jgi:uncharacterized protein
MHIENPSPDIIDLDSNPFSQIRIRSLIFRIIIEFFLYCILIGVILGIISTIIDFNTNDDIIEKITTFIFYPSILLTTLRYIKIDRLLWLFRSRTEIIFTHAVGLTSLLILFSLGAIWVVYFPLSYLYPGLVESILSNDNNFFKLSTEGRLNIINILLELILVVIFAPVVEEIVFRGVFLNRWIVKWSINKSIIISSILFGILHVDPLGAFLFGIIMSILYLKKQSLTMPILVHALNNLVVTLFVIYCHTSTEVEAFTLEEFRSDGWLYMSAFIITAPILIRYIHRNWPAYKMTSIETAIAE